MKSVQHLPVYGKVLTTFEYDFGNFFVFEGFVVSEINEGVIYSWENHARLVTRDITEIIPEYSNLIYISNRIYSYSVVPSDWIKFFNNQFELRAYAVVGHTTGSFLNMVIEALFFKKNIKQFTNLEEAINWAETF